MLNGLPVVREAFPRTVRLVSTARLRPRVLEALVSPKDAAALAEIEGATSNRLLAESRGTEGIGPGEFIHGVPYASFVNAAFACWKPREANRFNAARGAWYDFETCMREVAHHMSEFLARSAQFKGVVEYAEMFASMAGEFVELRQTPDHPCLNPDPAVGYPIGNAIADAARAQGLNGIIYPSVRQAGGTCIVALRPHAVQSVAPGAVYLLEWSGDEEPMVTRISE
jgi:hypothetical protein